MKIYENLIEELCTNICKSNIYRKCALKPECSGLTRVQAALVAVGSAQTQAAVAGVTRLREGRGGVDGVSPATQRVGGIQELGVGHRLWTHAQVQMVKAQNRVQTGP